VTLTAAFSDLEGDAISTYRWDLDGNGTPDRTTSAPRTTTSYSKRGTVHPSVTVVDARGGAARAATTVSVDTNRPRIGTLPKTGKHGKVTFKVTCLSRCRLTASLTFSSRALKRKLHLKAMRVTRISKSIRTTGARKITLRVPRKVRRSANRHDLKSLKLKLAVSARTSDGKAARKHRTVRVRF
jgi:PKD repeat protein